MRKVVLFIWTRGPLDTGADKLSRILYLNFYFPARVKPPKPTRSNAISI